MTTPIRLTGTALALLWAALALAMPASASFPGAVYVARLGGAIDPISARYLVRAIDRAEREEASALVIVLDTPGGLDSAMRSITQRMLVADVPLVVYVAPSGARAASAGAFVTLAAHVAAMAPGTNIGAAHPVAAGGGPSDPVMAGKMASDAASTARALAAQRGRNVEWADQAVRESASATEVEAQASGVVDLVARDLDDLLAQIDGRAVTTAAGRQTIAVRGAARVPIDMTVAELFLHTLLSPNVAFLLLNLGVFALIAELYHPGTLLPGLTGVISLLLGLVALGTLPVNWGAVALLVLAFGLFLADLHVAGHGVLSAAGLAAFGLGGTMLFSPVDAFPWQLERVTLNPWAVSPWLVAGTGALGAGYVLVVLRAALAARRLAPALPLGPGLGDVALALTDLSPRGVVCIDHEEWSAVADAAPVRRAVSGQAGGTGLGDAATSLGGAADLAEGQVDRPAERIRAGEVVEVVGRDGLHLWVRRAGSMAASRRR
jgi:membrane-bound serine protease (ClpP class)